MAYKPVLKFKLLSKDAKLPQYSHPEDAGFDVYSPDIITVAPRDRELIKLGIAAEIPTGWFVELRDRSSLALNHGLHCLAGAIDSDYRGEWGLVLINTGHEPYTIQKHDRIAQGILLPINQAKIIEVQELSETERGEGGFGSTGKK